MDGVTRHYSRVGNIRGAATRTDRFPRLLVGLPDSGGLRRVAGLRREEVAQLAAISTDYYTRIEQGRMQVYAPVLTALAQVLHLDDDQRDYLSNSRARYIPSLDGARSRRSSPPCSDCSTTCPIRQHSLWGAARTFSPGILWPQP
ncbi:helix-turn-helix domain-containing protein [Nocardia sp. NPDC127606]|uniref:helix-turn-helix domain-containing protein n=1 Tax=Nocardia sp. NPDC127606 TaxID=3345406 RepID=UPI00362C97EF